MADGAMEGIGNNFSHYENSVKVSEENQTLVVQKKSVHVSGSVHTEISQNGGMVKETTSNATSFSKTMSLSSAQPSSPAEEESTIVSDVPLSGFYSRKQLDSIINGTFIDKYKPQHQLGPDYVAPAPNFSTSYPHEAVKLRMEDTGYNSREPTSLVTEMEKVVSENRHQPALSVKKDGKWATLTYQQYWNQIHTIGKAFIKLGLKRYHSVAMLGFNAPPWFISNFAVIFAGGFSTGIYTTNTSSACEHVLKHSRTQIIIVENDKQLAKILEIRDNLPLLKAIVQYTGKSDHEDVFSWDDLMQIGQSMPEEPLQKRIKSLAINQCSTLTYTSGTTGNPKAVMLSQDILVHLMRAFEVMMHVQETWPSPITVISFLPLNHMAAQFTDMYATMAVGGHVYFAQPDAMKGGLRNTLLEVKPVMLVAVPRIFEKLKEKIEETLAQMNPIKASFVKWAMKKCLQYTKSCIEKSPRKPIGYGLAKSVVYKIRQQMGLDKTDYYITGGAPIVHEVNDFFMGLNIRLMESYGMTETSGPHVVNHLDSFRPGSGGKIFPDFKFKIADPDDGGNGEICMKGRNIFMGYMFDEENTKSTIDANGWVHSGDIGRIDSENYLYVTGRIKELIITAGGENVAPLFIEESVKAELPIISQAVAIGDKKKYLAMLLTIKTTMDMETYTPLDTLSDISIQWCRSVGSDAKTVQDILRKPDMKVMTAIQQGINRANEKTVSNVWRIRKWKIIPRDFSLEKGEVGPTMKLKRNVILQRYKDVIESMYA